MELKNSNLYHLGCDIGSTTVKVVALNTDNEVVFVKYERHYANIKETLLSLIKDFFNLVGNVKCTVSVTGSGGLNLAKYLKIEFIQEVIAVTSDIKRLAPDTDVVIELGGEDAKIIYLQNGIDQRMNGICAGGTGAFIDQMASLLQTDASGLNELAKNHTEIYPIAARCGVFAKSDIQPLINDGASRENLAASVFQAVVNQTISGLSCGRKIKGKVAFLGGPLFFLSELRNAFSKTLELTEDNVVFPKNAHLFAAEGAALYSKRFDFMELSGLIKALEGLTESLSETNRLEPLFTDPTDYGAFIKRQAAYKVKRKKLEDYKGKAFLGIDAGSTTTKLALIAEDGSLLYSFYSGNKGEPIEVAKDAIKDLLKNINPYVDIVYSCSTGYGETLLKDAFCLDEGEVETVAHYYAAKFFEPNVDGILDIGGQDMKFIKVKGDSIDNIILNEACSSGCGSFIENFANSMSYTAEEFAKISVFAKAPIDLGTRCTVFMNSNVKQAQKEGAQVNDIAAGLAYSVIKNALFKVIKLKDPEDLGKKVVVQGGTFYNDAVLKSFEIISGHEAIRPDIAGIMGAFGAALIAKERFEGQKSSMLSLEEMSKINYTTKMTHCSGCENRCRLTVNTFSGGRIHFSGNRCERGLANKGKKVSVPNLIEFKKDRIFGYAPLSEEKAFRGTIGMPRVLNIYEDYPFWATFFKALGFRLVLSPYSDRNLFQLGMDSIPSESECYPAKLAHGHIEWLIKEGIKNIFYPCVTFEVKERKKQMNCYNCPMVTSYPENIINNLESIKENDVKIVDPFIAFTDEKILTTRLCDVINEEYGISKKEIASASKLAWAELMQCKRDIEMEGLKTLNWLDEHNKRGIVLAGRPYHMDFEVNHGIPEMIQSFGFAILTEDSIAWLKDKVSTVRATNQWTYHARLYAAAEVIAERNNVDLIQLNSFGCGLDAITTDQVQDLLEGSGKLYTLLKIDEVNNLGAAKIRVRSLISAINMRDKKGSVALTPVKDYERVKYTKEMQAQKYTLLCSCMSPIHFDFFEATCRACGYNFVMMKNEGQNILDMGLKYVNNDACYPAIITTGQVLDAVTSGNYDTNKLAVIMVQTGGGCRASNYIGFIRKALESSGYGHIPVISISPNLIETNPGFAYTFKMGFKALQSMIYGDILMRVLYRMRPYEKEKGAANRLYDKWRKICVDDISKSSVNGRKFKKNCLEMIREFDALPIHEDLVKPKVGIVGEVLVKFMPVANDHLVEILEEEGMEVVMPDFINFIQYCFWNSIYKMKYLGGSKPVGVIAKIAVRLMDFSRRNVFKEFKKSKHFESALKLEDIKNYALEILQLGNQCGEGWFLPGEIIDLVKTGVNNVVCAQPFGCLPNHIVGKGMINKIKSLYPTANVVAIDYDPSASKVNQYNRIKLMLENAKENIISEA